MSILDEILAEIQQNQNSGVGNDLLAQIMQPINQQGLSAPTPDVLSFLNQGMPQGGIGQTPQPNLGFALPTNSAFNPLMSANSSSLYNPGQPDFMSAMNAPLTTNPNDYMRSNDDILARASDYQNKVSGLVGNEASKQIDSLISDIQMQKSAAKQDVGIGTKLLGTALGALGGASGNQALIQQGYGIIEGGRAQLKAKRDQLDQQEIQLRTLKYTNELQKENQLKDTYTKLQIMENQYGNNISNQVMDYRQKVTLAKLDGEIKAKEKANNAVMARDAYLMQFTNEKDLSQLKMQAEYTLQYGAEGADMARRVFNGQPWTPEQNKLADMYSKGSIANRQLNIDEGNANFRQSQVDKNTPGVTPVIAPGSLSNVINLNDLDSNSTKFKLAGKDKTYNRFKQDVIASVQGSNGALKTGLDPKLDNVIAQSAQENNIPPEVLFAKLKAESGFNLKLVAQPNKAYSASDGRNAVGLSQITRDTAKSRGIDYERLKTDPEYAIREGAKMFGELYAKNDGDLEKTLINYNYGSGYNIKSVDLAAKKFIILENGREITKTIPNETQEYIAKIQGVVDGYREFAGTNKQDPKTRENRINQANQFIEQNVNAYIRNGIPDIDPLTSQPKRENPNDPTSKTLMRQPSDKELAVAEMSYINSIVDKYQLKDDQWYLDNTRSIKQRIGMLEQDSQLLQKENLNSEVLFNQGVDAQIIREMILSNKDLTEPLKISALDSLEKMDRAVQDGRVKLDPSGYKRKMPVSNPINKPNIGAIGSSGLTGATGAQGSVRPIQPTAGEIEIMKIYNQNRYGGK